LTKLSLKMSRSILLSLAAVLACCTFLTDASPGMHYSYGHSLAGTPSTFPYTNSYRRSRRSPSSSSPNYAIAALSGRRKQAPPEPLPPSPVAPPNINFDDLGPIGKTVAGVTQIVTSTILEYISGFVMGMVIGTVVGVPGFLFRPIEPGVPKVFMQEVSGRLSRMTTRNVLWAKNWGGISAAFGGCKVAVKVIRNGEESEWNDEWDRILSSAAAGAFFGRNGTFYNRRDDSFLQVTIIEND
jgi:hypothetical protein